MPPVPRADGPRAPFRCRRLEAGGPRRGVSPGLPGGGGNGLLGDHRRRALRTPGMDTGAEEQGRGRTGFRGLRAPADRPALPAEPGRSAGGLGAARRCAVTCGHCGRRSRPPIHGARVRSPERRPVDRGGGLRGERSPLREARFRYVRLPADRLRGDRRQTGSWIRGGPGNDHRGPRAAGPGDRGAPGPTGVSQRPGILRRGRDLPRAKLP